MINNNAAVELVHVVNPSGGSGEGYTAGAGITISDQNEIGIDQSVVATKAYVTQEIGTVREVPEASSADSGKVLGVTDSEGTLGWVANGGGASYTAGTGIDISAQNEISVDTTVIATQNDLSGLQPTLTAGTNISISNNTISATDTTYTAGTGLSLTGTEFAVDTTVIASKNDLPSSDELLPSATSSDEGKVLTIDSQGEAGWETPASVDEVPAVTSNDDGKVLKATYSGGVGSYAWATESGGGSSYTAGTGIDITNDTISVDTTVVATQTDLSGIEQVPTVTSTDDGKVLTASYSGGTGSFAWATPSGGSSNVFVWEAGTTTNQEVYDAIAAGKDIFIHAVESGDNVVYRMYKYFLSSGTYFVYSSTYSEQGGTGNTGCMVQCIAYVTQNNNVANYKSQMNVSFITDKTDTYDSTSKKAMTGVAVASAISGVTLASLNTAGITDIQQVAALPANPVATVLYLIPQT